MKKEQNMKLKVIPIGGLGLIGMNITAFEYNDSIIIVDCGMAFPENDMLGIDVVIPDVTYLKDNIDKVKGMVFTHGHEDHIGALPYILRELNVPLYATKLTMGLIERKLTEHNLMRGTKRKVVGRASRSIWENSGSSLSRQTTVFRMQSHWRFILRQVSWYTREILRSTIRLYSVMRLTCSALLRSGKRVCWR